MCHAEGCPVPQRLGLKQVKGLLSPHIGLAHIWQPKNGHKSCFNPLWLLRAAYMLYSVQSVHGHPLLAEVTEDDSCSILL